MDNPSAELIGRLSALCDRSPHTRSEIAARAGLSPQNFSRLLAGHRDPSIGTFARVLAALEAPWAALDGDGPKPE